MSIRIQLKQNQKFHVAISLVQRRQYLDALDRFKELLIQNKYMLPDILILLYKHLRNDYHNHHIRLVIAELLIHTYHYETAISELKEALEMDKSFTQPFFLLCKIYSKNECQEKIITIFENAFEKQIFDSVILDLLPKYYLENKQFDKSIHFYQTLLKQSPNNLSYYRSLAEIYLANWQYENAATIYEKMIKISPESRTGVCKTIEKLVHFCPDNIKIREFLIKLYLMDHNPNMAIQHIQAIMTQDSSSIVKCIDLYKNALKLYPKTQSLLFELAKLLIQKKQYSEGIDFLKEIADTKMCDYAPIKELLQSVLSENPNQLMALELLADIHFQNKDYDNSFPLIHQILEFSHLDHYKWLNQLTTLSQSSSDYQLEARLLLAKLFLNSKNINRCLSECEALLQTDYRIHAKYIQIDAHIANNEPQQAKDNLIQLLHSNPGEWQALHKLQQLHYQALNTNLSKYKAEEKKHEDEIYYLEEGLLYLRLNQFENAIDRFQLILKDAFLKEKALVLIGRCFMALGRFEMAINHFKRVIELIENIDQNTVNNLRFFIAINAFHLGKIQDAISNLEKILESNISFPHLKSLLKQFKAINTCHNNGLLLSAYANSTNEPINLFCIHKTMPSTKKNTAHTISMACPHNDDGVNYFMKHQYQSAEEAFNTAIQLDGSFLNAYCNLALLYLHQEKPYQAIALLEQAAFINNRYDVIDTIKGLVYLAQKEYQSAETCFLESLDKCTNNDIVKLNLCEIYIQTKQTDKAFEIFNDLLQGSPYYYLVLKRLDCMRGENLPPDCWFQDFSIDLNSIISADHSDQIHNKPQENFVGSDLPLFSFTNQ